MSQYEDFVTLITSGNYTPSELSEMCKQKIVEYCGTPDLQHFLNLNYIISFQNSFTVINGILQVAPQNLKKISRFVAKQSKLIRTVLGISIRTPNFVAGGNEIKALDIYAISSTVYCKFCQMYNIPLGLDFNLITSTTN